MEARDYGCLKCKVIWRGEPVCWLCHEPLYVVGAAVLRAELEKH